ncbi:MAG: toprim domain-containing protein [Acidimicrobiia bacterium]
MLADRRLPESVLRANRVGADPGPHVIPRARGLPHAGPAVVFPVFDKRGGLAYLQARYLAPDRVGRKYDNPSAALAQNPRVGVAQRPHHPPTHVRGVLVVAEGIPDALTAVGAGVPAVAVLGAGVPDERTVGRLLSLAGRRHLVITFDADERGRVGAQSLTDLVARQAPGRATRLAPPVGDLNSWAQEAGSRFPDAFANAIRDAVPIAARLPTSTAIANERSLGIGLA